MRPQHAADVADRARKSRANVAKRITEHRRTIETLEGQVQLLTEASAEYLGRAEAAEARVAELEKQVATLEKKVKATSTSRPRKKAEDDSK